jgi:hypothetical protein
MRRARDVGEFEREAWPADQVERWPIDRLIPYAKNSRTHSEAQIAQLAASLKEWGWTNPVLADEVGGVIAGHARILAARQLGIAEVQSPCQPRLIDSALSQIVAAGSICGHRARPN